MPPDKKDDEPKVFPEENLSNRELAAKIRDLENTLAATRGAVNPLSLVPEHGGGDGTDIAETWSLTQQEHAKAVAQGWPGHSSTFQPPGQKP